MNNEVALLYGVGYNQSYLWLNLYIQIIQALALYDISVHIVHGRAKAGPSSSNIQHILELIEAKITQLLMKKSYS